MLFPFANLTVLLLKLDMEEYDQVAYLFHGQYVLVGKCVRVAGTGEKMLVPLSFCGIGALVGEGSFSICLSFAVFTAHFPRTSHALATGCTSSQLPTYFHPDPHGCC